MRVSTFQRLLPFANPERSADNPKQHKKPNICGSFYLYRDPRRETQGIEKDNIQRGEQRKTNFTDIVFYRLGVLPSNLNRLLIIVVVLSMALTPLLNELGRWLAAKIDDYFTEVIDVDADAQTQITEAVEPIVIIGFGQLGQVGMSFDCPNWPRF